MPGSVEIGDRRLLGAAAYRVIARRDHPRMVSCPNQGIAALADDPSESGLS